MLVQSFLEALGARIRSFREAAGLSVTETAREAGLSRRYLTEAEAGRANPSVAVLAKLAVVLGVSLRDLVDVELPRRGVERIALVGLRGAGKTTVGRLLARELEVPFVELDQRIEELAGLSLAELFDVHGEASYRRFESEALESVLSQAGRIVLATGGSLVTAPKTFERLRNTCSTVWLDATPEEHFERVLAQGDSRPMHNRPRAMEELRAILDGRRELYALCDLHIQTSERSPAEVMAAICEALDRSSAA